jgi:hypothetical protein
LIRASWITLYSWSTWWTKETVIDLSPTAAATRLIFPARTSPAGKTPGIKEAGRAAERPVRRARFFPGKIRSRFDESLLVAHDTPIEPLRIGSGAGHQEDAPNGMGFDVTGQIVSPAHDFEMIIAFERCDFHLRTQNDCRVSSMRRICKRYQPGVQEWGLCGAQIKKATRWPPRHL